MADEDRIRTFMSKVRQINSLIVLLAFAAYGLAYYVWTLGQSMGALVIATLGYFLFRGLRKISFNFAWRCFAPNPEYQQLLTVIDADLIMQGEMAICERLMQQSSKINEVKK